MIATSLVAPPTAKLFASSSLVNAVSSLLSTLYIAPDKPALAPLKLEAVNPPHAISAIAVNADNEFPSNSK